MNTNGLLRGGTCALLLVSCLTGSTPAGDVLGVVRDSDSGQPLSGISVIILESADTAVTDGSGEYFFSNVADGSYTFLVGGPAHGTRVLSSVTLGTCCLGARGDINGDGVDLDPVDLSCLVDYLFGSGCFQPCPDESDLNADGAVADPVDLSLAVDYLFSSGTSPAACP